MAAPCYILEGTWWSHREVPKVLPFFQALRNGLCRIDLSHRTIQSADDIGYWISKIPRGAQAFLYIACHGRKYSLYPEQRSPVCREEVLAMLERASPGAIAFLHFGCCEMVALSRRGDYLREYGAACNARWISGYGTEVDWVQSTLLDLALVADLYIPYYESARQQTPKLKVRAQQFIRTYGELARQLGFAGLCRNLGGVNSLVPKTVRYSRQLCINSRARRRCRVTE